MKHDTILVLDFGGQYAHLIGRRIREHNVYSEIAPCDATLKEIKQIKDRLNVKGIILSGGPSSVYETDAPTFDSRIMGLNLPILGICYGHQLIVHVSKGVIKRGDKKEYGITQATIEKPIDILDGLRKTERVWMSHGDVVSRLPAGYEVVASTENCPVAAFRHKQKQIYGLQWHPEVVHTDSGMKMLWNFIFNICKCQPTWTMEDFITSSLEGIRKIVGGGKAILALSGGIDSSTTAVLAARVIGKNLTAVFVDHGFMRLGEPEFVRESFREFGLNLIIVDARERFLRRLKNVFDPEQKRKIIGEEFIRVFEGIASEAKAPYLLQGTIYPDRIESGFKKHSDKIKSHHNVGGLPLKIDFKEIVEPLKDLYKDEVRKIAKKLGLSDEIALRQPFPGPGLAVRILGEVTQEKLDIVKKADGIVTEEIEKRKLDEGLWQYFAVLTEARSTGVRGDARTYGYTVVVRVVESREAMTARFARISYDVLETISTRITNEIPQVSRVVYDITHKPPATIEWE
ncbi:MAG: glutamine-hydrolyzing GMP synthase [Candidatus Hodarchaeota archaeon]